MARVANKSAKQIKDEDFLKQLQKASNKTLEVKHIEAISEETVTENATPEISFEELKDMFGRGFDEPGYREMHKRFVALSNNYPLRTEMHREALLTYTKYAFRRDEAIADGDIDAADKWGKLAAKQAADAKINPSQLSAADLSDGMTSFSQLSAMVEKAQDIIPLLPQFIEEPKDRVDYTLWEYINYARHLDGKPLIEYKELYKFLEARYESLKKRYKFMKKEEDGNFDTDDIDSEV